MRKLISDVIIDDVLIEASPALADPERSDYLVEQRQLLRPMLNRIVRACRSPETFPVVVAALREKACRLDAAAALDLFVRNMVDASDELTSLETWSM